MNDLNTTSSAALEWLKFIDNSTVQSGNFHAKNELGDTILLEWEKVNPQSSRLAEIITQISDLLVCLRID